MAVDEVGFDVHLTKAGALLGIHDPARERTTLGTGKVAERAPPGGSDAQQRGRGHADPGRQRG